MVYHDGSYYNEKTCEYVTVFAPRNGYLQKVTQKYGDDIEKYILVLAMILGRLELLVAMAFFLPIFWKQ